MSSQMGLISSKGGALSSSNGYVATVKYSRGERTDIHIKFSIHYTVKSYLTSIHG